MSLTEKLEPLEHDYMASNLSLLRDPSLRAYAQDDTLNVCSCSLSDEDISAPLYVRSRSLSWSLSEVEVEPK